jgi:hypothetical protein
VPSCPLRIGFVFPHANPHQATFSSFEKAYTGIETIELKKMFRAVREQLCLLYFEEIANLRKIEFESVFARTTAFGFCVCLRPEKKSSVFPNLSDSMHFQFERFVHQWPLHVPRVHQNKNWDMVAKPTHEHTYEHDSRIDFGSIAARAHHAHEDGESAFSVLDLADQSKADENLPPYIFGAVGPVGVVVMQRGGRRFFGASKNNRVVDGDHDFLGFDDLAKQQGPLLCQRKPRESAMFYCVVVCGPMSDGGDGQYGFRDMSGPGGGYGTKKQFEKCWSNSGRNGLKKKRYPLCQ